MTRSERAHRQTGDRHEGGRPIGAAIWRTACVGAGVSLVIGGGLWGERLLATYLSPDGHITEVAYVTLFQLGSLVLGVSFVGLGFRGRITTIQNVVTLLGSVLLVLGGVEGTLRAVEAQRPASPDRPTGLQKSTTPGLYYENSPNFYEDGELKFNSLGLRDDERTLVSGRPTIVVVGDSIEAWRSLPARDLYPRVLESSLRQHYEASLQVVNLGVSGYSLHQKVLMLEDRGFDWNPRAAVIGYCLNDPIPAWELVNHFTDIPKRRPWRTAEFVNGRLRTALHRYGLDFYSQIHQADTDEWRGVERDFDRLGQLGRERNTQIFVVIFPLMLESGAGYPWMDIHHRVADAARRNGLAVIDLLESFQRVGLDRVRDDAVHPNARGHLIAARALETAITETHSGREPTTNPQPDKTRHGSAEDGR